MMFLVTGTAVAQTADPVTRNEATLNFPNDVVFELDVAPDFELAAAKLTYDVSKTTCLEATATVPVEVTGNNLEWKWVMSRSGNPPPGAAMWWQWTLTDTSGNEFTTPPQTLTFTDDRFDWQTVSEAGVRVNWYGPERIGPLLLEAAVSGLDRLQHEMGIELQNTVQFYIYDDYDDMRNAVLYVQDWAGAVAFDEYNIILMGVPANIADDWGVKTVSHELAHLVVGQFGRSCVGGRRPTWLEEGLAVYAEGEPQADVVEDIENGVRDNSFEPLRSLTGPFSSHSTDAGIAYSQSYSVVDFMLHAYGQEKMQELILLLAAGEGYDEALTAVYNLNMDGLELAWREAMGLPPREIPPTPTPLTAVAVPTYVPLSAPASLPTPPSANESPPEETGGITVCGLGAMPLMLVGFWLAGKRKNDGI
ncbi:MAG: hypothetical protein H6658_20900 [Ardenticatenaceae bacterium]|nr:hypothetical protein [Ardenticatenaceae bacterium]